MTSSSIDPETKKSILELIHQSPMSTTDILQELRTKDLALAQIQDALAILLDTGAIEMGPDRRLHLTQIPA